MPRPDLSMTSDAIRSFLSEPHIGVLSTLDRQGFPHSVGIYYDVDGDDLRMWVYGKSQKVTNVDRDPRCALLVEHGEPYVNLKGVLLRGEGRVERDFDTVFELGRLLYERYFQPRIGIPFAEGPEERIRKQSEKRVCLVVTPKRVASWDHSKASSSTGGP